MSCCKYLYPIWTSVTRNINLIFISLYMHTHLVSFWCFIRERFYISMSQIYIYIYIYIYVYIYIYIYAIMKTMCPPGHHHNGVVATHALGHLMYDSTVHHVLKCMTWRKTIVVITGRAHCFHDCTYITLILLLWDLSTLYIVDHLWPLIYR